ncbi:MAG: hypothetical protein J6S71_02845 [Clostridia bacterium]|nr:hypothetical protein [Clostridia bacterium]
MYLLKKLGIPLIALLILSVLALITVVLLYENNGIQLPNFNRPQTEAPESELPIQSEESAKMNFENYYSVLSGGNNNE